MGFLARMMRPRAATTSVISGDGPSVVPAPTRDAEAAAAAQSITLPYLDATAFNRGVLSTGNLPYFVEQIPHGSIPRHHSGPLDQDASPTIPLFLHDRTPVPRNDNSNKTTPGTGSTTNTPVKRMSDSAPDSALNPRSPLSPFPHSDVIFKLDNAEHAAAGEATCSVILPTNDPRFFVRERSSESDGSASTPLWATTLKQQLEEAVNSAIAQGASPAKAQNVAKSYFFNYDEALLNCSPLPEPTPCSQQIQEGNSLYERGKRLASDKKHREAISCFEEAIKNMPTPTDQARCYQKIALSYYFLGDMNLAEKNCNVSKDLNPSYYKVHHTLSAIYRNKHFTSKAENDSNLAAKYKKQQAESLITSTSYAGNSSPKEELAASIEQIIMNIEEGNIKDAKTNIIRAQKSIKKEQSILAKGTDPKSIEKLRECEVKLQLIDEVEKCIEMSVFENAASTAASSSSKQVPSPHERIAQNSLEIFPLSLNAEQLYQQLKKMNQEIEALKQQSQHLVRREEVSEYIPKNAELKEENSQDSAIQSDPHLNDYFKAFVSTISSFYTSSKSIADKKIAIDASNIASIIAKQLLNLIPICGNTIGKLAAAAIVQVKKAQIETTAAHFCSIAYDSVELHKTIVPAARTITLSKRDQILSTKNVDIKEKGFFQKIGSSIDSQTKSYVYGQEYKSVAQRLGHDDAREVIKKYLENCADRKRTSDSPQNVEVVRDFIIKVIVHCHVYDEAARAETAAVAECDNTEIVPYHFFDEAARAETASVDECNNVAQIVVLDNNTPCQKAQVKLVGSHGVETSYV